MRKIDSLSATLRAAIPEVSNDPAALPVWIDRGSARARQTGSNAFELSFRLNVLAIGVRTDLSIITLAITRWLRAHQPVRLQPGSDSFSFDADILDNGTADVLIQIDLTQNYEVSTINGEERVEPVEQTDSVLEEANAEGLAPDIAAILLGGEQLVPPA
ncbi:phage tail protein [Novosphingobium sp. CCH12-A3]|uniref:phage tail protein n=1 Tax=Novosphingobium sp. CCH12-A3 TaxID=1768752 RepID=UPI0007862B0D|nr:phage tail protein [Novosphingobium sp. CCH12-A3]